MSEMPNRERPNFDSISTLVPLARQGDQQAQNLVLKQIQDYVLRMANQQLGPALRRKVSPSDVAQVTMTRMIDGFEEFRGSSEAEFFAWLRTILKREVVRSHTHHTRQKRDFNRELEVLTSSGRFANAKVADRNLTPGSEAIKNEKIRVLEIAMAKLPIEPGSRTAGFDYSPEGHRASRDLTSSRTPLKCSRNASLSVSYSSLSRLLSRMA